MQNNVPNRLLSDKKFALAFYSLLAANFVTIVMFALRHGNIKNALWSYWVQSVLIGVFTVIQIVGRPAREVSKAFLTDEDGIAPKLPKSDGANTAIKYGAAIFFLLHYGFFHVIYAIILNTAIFEEGKSQTHFHTSVFAVILAGTAFAVFESLRLSRTNHNKQSQKKLGVKQILNRPYIRIIPMHVIIISGTFVQLKYGNSAVFVCFMLLKTAVDTEFLYRDL